MFKRILNILIFEQNEKNLSEMEQILKNPGHNIFMAKTTQEANQLIKQNTFAFLFIDLDSDKFDSALFFNNAYEIPEVKNATVIITSDNEERLHNCLVENSQNRTMDYLRKPFIPFLLKSKLATYKRLHFKHQRVSQLLESILPAQTLKEFRLYGKSSPKKKINCSVLFTDFVNFTQKTKSSDAQEIVQKLDYYFSSFDEIMTKYNLEKIKTIGDAYMAVAGVTESDTHPSVRMALAAMEIRQFVNKEIKKQKALGGDFWEIRIGIHQGNLVAGVVGKNKFSFDVWGDTVNIAARCEQNSFPNKINISGAFNASIQNYFITTERGKLPVKNAGEVEMYFLNEIKTEYSLYGKGQTSNLKLRKEINLPHADFEGIRTLILDKLSSELDENLLYHSVLHTLGVEEAVIKYGKLERISKHELFILRTAAVFHDAGFLYSYKDNEESGVKIFEQYAPDFGYNKKDIALIKTTILATAYGTEPTNILEEILCDADLDYLGRIDYHITADRLFNEKERFGNSLSAKEKLERQITYLEHHHVYYTTSARNLRAQGKSNRIAELKERLKNLS